MTLLINRRISSTCLTNEAKLFVLKYFGRTFSANSFGFLTLNAFPSSFQLIISPYSGFYNLFQVSKHIHRQQSRTSRILYVLERNPGTVLLFLEALRFLISVNLWLLAWIRRFIADTGSVLDSGILNNFIFIQKKEKVIFFI